MPSPDPGMNPPSSCTSSPGAKCRNPTPPARSPLQAGRGVAQSIDKLRKGGLSVATDGSSDDIDCNIEAGEEVERLRIIGVDRKVKVGEEAERLGSSRLVMLERWEL
ncbi:hypothetical protein COCNU_scaffold012225G000020 [Cocos nucifera]|nr:hypothetical protein [Cocos nucifera]